MLGGTGVDGSERLARMNALGIAQVVVHAPLWIAVIATGGYLLAGFRRRGPVARHRRIA